MAEAQLVLPGDVISPPDTSSNKKQQPLRLGPGLRLVPPQTIVSTVAGQLVTDRKKNSLYVEYNGGRYIPSQGDLVIAQIHRSSADFHYAILTPYTSHALLPALAFEGATKKTRPMLAPGSLVYARVALANKHMDPELECVNQATGKSENLGPLASCDPENPSTVVPVSLGMARRLLMPRIAVSGVVVLEEMEAGGLMFEMATGRNGKVWIGGEDVWTVAAVGRAITQTDELRLDVAAQKKLVKKLLKGKPS